MAVRQLFRRLEGDTSEPVVLEVPFALEIRESTLSADQAKNSGAPAVPA
jgi:hypothetical protein